MARKRGGEVVTNADIAELLALEAKTAAAPVIGKALRRASRLAFTWEVEAAELLRNSRPLTDLKGVGPFISKLLTKWIEQKPPVLDREETRKDFLTLTEARAILEKSPRWKSLYKGDLQMHTHWSDGTGSVREMAEAALKRGYSFIGLTDHSKGLKIAGGIDEEELRKQGEEIEEVDAALKSAERTFTVLKSVELNLNPRGQGDMDSKSLSNLDLVVGSFHSALRKSDDQTARYLAALENPNVHILGHPRGRIYNFRVGLRADWRRVFDRAAELGKAVEVDSYPDRQDLNIELLSLARSAGCLIAIDTDAHHPWQLGFVEYGLAAALRARIDPSNVINFEGAASLKKRFGTG